MKVLWKVTVLFALATFGCKTPDATSGVKSDLSGPDPVAGSAEAFDIGSLPGTFWKASFEAQFSVVATLRVEAEGNGLLSINADGETQTLDFAAVRMATPDEVEMVRTRLDKTYLDSKGNEITYTEAVVIADENGALKNVFPVLHGDELMLHPMGPLIKQAEMPESDVARCGGMAGLKCPSGFQCKGAVMDMMGSCIKAGATTTTTTGKPAPSGTNAGKPKCGGFAGFQCPPDLICKQMPPHPDGMGVCEEAPAKAPAKKPSGKKK